MFCWQVVPTAFKLPPGFSASWLPNVFRHEHACEAELLVIGGCDAEAQEIKGDCQSLSNSTRTYDPVEVSHMHELQRTSA